MHANQAESLEQATTELSLLAAQPRQGLHHARNALGIATQRFNDLGNRFSQQVREAQDALAAARKTEETHFQQAMQAMFQQHLQHTQTALRPQIAMAWKTLGAMILVVALLLTASVLLLQHQYRRLQAATARAEAAEVHAEITAVQRQALAAATSCGGRACVRIDKNAPRWRANGEYVLLQPAPQSAQR